MVIVVQEEPTTGFGGTGFIGATIEFFRSNWKFMFVALIIILLAIIIWYLFKKIEEERHEREEPGYQLFKTVKASCRLNGTPTLIRKKWNPKSLLLIFIPIVGWILIPFIKKDHSAKLIDYNGELLGYYRGDYKGMDDTTNFLVYKHKKFLFFEDQFVIKVPTKLRMKAKKRDDETGKLKLDEKTKKPILEDKTINLNDLIKVLPNKDIKI